jgi:integrase
MMWRKTGRPTWNVWVSPMVGARVACSTETANADRAAGIEAWMQELRDRHDRKGVLAAIAGREITLAKAYHLGEDGAAALLDAERAAKAAAGSSVDVWPMLTEWTTQRSRGKKPVKTAAEQMRMVRHVFPEQPCPASLWTADEIERRLTDLKGKTWKGKARVMQDATRNRYRSVVSQAADHLRRKKVLQSNPVDGVDRYAENPLTFAYLELADAQQLVGALNHEGQIVAALALGFGMEWQAIKAAEVRDLDLTAWTCHAHGGKTHWRDRVSPLSDVFAFLQPILRQAVAGKLPRAKLVTSPEWVLLDHQKATAAAVGVTPITLHQWRHSCAVILLQAGELPANVAHLLGHKDSSLVIKRYGRFIVRAAHFVTRQASSATQLATGTQ